LGNAGGRKKKKREEVESKWMSSSALKDKLQKNSTLGERESDLGASKKRAGTGRLTQKASGRGNNRLPIESKSASHCSRVIEMKRSVSLCQGVREKLPKKKRD